MTTRDEPQPVAGEPLLQVLQDLLAETSLLRAEVRAVRRRNLIFGVSLLLSVLIGGGVAVDARHQIALNTARWCPVAVAYLSVPPQLPEDPVRRRAALEVRAFFEDLRRRSC